MCSSTQISSVEEFISTTRTDSAGWQPHVWFRGELGDVETPLIPKLYRGTHDENELLQNFRRGAPHLTPGSCPDLKATDQWLFVAQHFSRRFLWYSKPTIQAVSVQVPYQRP
jgi:hypothetical protein